MAKPQKDEGPRCGDCRFYRTEEQPDIGECFANPPTTSFDEDGSFYNVRPVVQSIDYPCRHFQAKQ